MHAHVYVTLRCKITCKPLAETKNPLCHVMCWTKLVQIKHCGRNTGEVMHPIFVLLRACINNSSNRPRNDLWIIYGSWESGTGLE